MTHTVATPAAPRTSGRLRTALVAVTTTATLALSGLGAAAPASAVPQQSVGTAVLPFATSIPSRAFDPYVEGSPTVGGTLTLRVAPVPSGVSGGTVSVQWHQIVNENTLVTTPIEGATSLTYQPTAADLGKRIRPVVTYSAPGYTTVQSSTAPLAIGTVAPVPTVAPSLPRTGVGTSFSVDAGTWPGYLSHSARYFIDGEPLPSGTNIPQFAHVGKSLTALVTVRTETGSAIVWTAPTVIVAGTLVATAQPSIASPPRVGAAVELRETSLASTGGAVSSRHRSLVWMVDGQPVSTASRFVPTVADLGKAITVRETITTPGFATFVATTAPATVVKGTLNRDVRFYGFQDAATVGYQVYLWLSQPSTAIGEKLSIAWIVGGTEIPARLGPSANYLTYTPKPEDVGKEVGAKVTFTAPGYNDLVVRTSTFTVVAGSINDVDPPEITGKAVVGATVTGTVGTWYPSGDSDALVTYTTRWLRDGEPIAGTSRTGTEPRATYTLTADDEGADISFEVTASSPGYTAKTRTSAAVRGTLPRVEQRTAPAVAGTARLGETLTATTGAWSPSPSSTTFQWLRDGAAIAGATAARYTPTTADVGRKLAVRVTVGAAGHLPATATSATVTVAPGTLKATAQPRVTGTASIGKTLTATPGTWSTTGTTLSYQWLRSGTVISGATRSTYAVTKADIGSALSVRVTATAPGRVAATATSAATSTVAKVTPKVTLSAPASVKTTARAKVTVKVAASPVTSAPAGRVTITWGSGAKNKATVTLKASHKGTLTYKLPKLAKGKRTVTATFTPATADGKHLTKAKSSRTLKVR